MDDATIYILTEDRLKKMERDGFVINEGVILLGMGIVGILAIISVIAVAYIADEVAKIIDKGYKICSGKYKQNTPEYKRCISAVKVDGYGRVMKELRKKASSDCPKSKNPKKCGEQVRKAMTKLKMKLDKEKSKLKEIEAKIKRHSRY